MECSSVENFQSWTFESYKMFGKHYIIPRRCRGKIVSVVAVWSGAHNYTGTLSHARQQVVCLSSACVQASSTLSCTCCVKAKLYLHDKLAPCDGCTASWFELTFSRSRIATVFCFFFTFLRRAIVIEIGELERVEFPRQPLTVRVRKQMDVVTCQE